MATATVSVPHKNPNLVSPTSWYKTREGLKSQMEQVWAKYGKFFKEYGESSRIPPAILLAFTMIESNGNPKAIILGQYADAEWGTQDGKLRMDRIIALYNWGSGGFKKNNIANKSIADVIKSIPSTTAVYINKMLGSNGSLDVAVNDMKIS